MSKFSRLLHDKRILVSDGAMGTMLQNAGMPSGANPEEWGSRNPDVVKRISLDYFLAGSDMVLTNTFGVHPVKLGKSGIGDKVEELCGAAVRAARMAAEESGRADGLVVLSLGPTGDFLKPLGTLDPEDVGAGYRRAAAAALDAGADAACVETFTDAGEASLAVSAAAAAGLDVLATMSFDAGAAGFRTMMGVSPQDAARVLHDAGAAAVGANCGSLEMADMAAVIEEMAPHVPGPYVVHANAGRPELRGGSTYFPQQPADMGRAVAAVLKAGCSIIGGCCGTTPEHVRSIRAAVDAFLSG
ncbi:MAG: homocysteine S-methyltransferase family protein [Planctomycetes bacterium]|nr:homocysteine S-methyltransferase family protein [Planctomycetota bacterium]